MCGVLLGCDLVDVVKGWSVHDAKFKFPDWLYKYLDTIILNCLFVILDAGFNGLNGDFFPDFSLNCQKAGIILSRKHFYRFF